MAPGSGRGLPRRFRLSRRAAQRRQVDPDQRPGRARRSPSPPRSRRRRGTRSGASSPTSTSQLVLVDTPGLHKPRTLLGERLNDVVRETLLEVDVIGFCLPADQRIGPGDAFIAKELREIQQAKRRPVVAIATKTDRVDRQRLAEHLIAIDQLGSWDAIVPCSAVDGSQVDEVAAVLASLPARVARTALPRGRAHRRAGRRDDRRAGARGRPRGGARRAAALPGRRRGGDGAARGAAGGQATARRAGQRLRGAFVAEGDRHRTWGRAAARGRHERAAAASRRCSARRSTSTCT